MGRSLMLLGALVMPGNFTFFFPLMTSLLLSAGLTLILWLLRKLGG